MATTRTVTGTVLQPDGTAYTDWAVRFYLLREIISDGDADVQNLAELRAAWATYDVTTNDSHSKMWSDGGAMLLFMRKR